MLFYVFHSLGQKDHHMHSFISDTTTRLAGQFPCSRRNILFYYLERSITRISCSLFNLNYTYEKNNKFMRLNKIRFLWIQQNQQLLPKKPVDLSHSLFSKFMWEMMYGRRNTLDTAYKIHRGKKEPNQFGCLLGKAWGQEGWNTWQSSR